MIERLNIEAIEFKIRITVSFQKVKLLSKDGQACWASKPKQACPFCCDGKNFWGEADLWRRKVNVGGNTKQSDTNLVRQGSSV